MANLSANILREIVARTFKVNATKVVLSGVIDGSVSWCSNTCWSSQSTEYSYRIFSFCAEKGFHQLDVVNHTHNNNDGSASDTDAKYENLAIALREECPESIFILEFKDCSAYDDKNSYNKVTLYKSPDWKQYFDKITQEDIARWQQWLENDNSTEFETREDFVFNHLEFPAEG